MHINLGNVIVLTKMAKKTIFTHTTLGFIILLIRHSANNCFLYKKISNDIVLFTKKTAKPA